MKKKVVLIFWVIIIVINQGCKGLDSYNLHSRSKKITNRHYIKDDTIVVQNYILCNSQNNMSILSYENKPIPYNADSVTNILVHSLSRLNLTFKFKFDEGYNYCDDTFFENRLARISKIEDNRIKQISTTNYGNVVLVPFVYINNAIMFKNYMSSSGVSSDDGFSVVSHLNLVIYILKNNEIIYRKHMRYGANSVNTEFRSEARAVPNGYMVNQEHWDELVKKVMTEYIKSR
jgi:hypothetical protein